MKSQNSDTEKNPMQEKYGDNPKKFMRGLDAVIYDLYLEKIEREKLDQQYKENKIKEDSKKLAKMSKILISLRELYKLLRELKAGHSVVINEHGEIFTGKVNTEKLHAIQVKIPGKTPAEFDGNGFEEFYPTSSSVNAPDAVWKNWWDTLKVKLYKGDSGNITVDMFKDAMDYFLSQNEDNISQLKKHVKVNQRNETYYMEISIPNFPIIGGFGKNGKMYYFITENKVYWIS